MKPGRQEPRALQLRVEAGRRSKATDQVSGGAVSQHPVPSACAKTRVAAVPVARAVAARAVVLGLADGH
eukprot:8436989-Pyramimonas_sp.AAC.1